MSIFLNIVSIFLALLSAPLICLNWKCFYFTYIKKQNAGSWIPIIPGALFMFALILNPEDNINRFAWTGLFIDWGCLPGFVFTLFWCFVTFIKNKLRKQ